METIARPGLVRVVLTGSESTGKTTLAHALATRWGVPCVPEFVRGYAAAQARPIEFADHAPIAHGQMALEEEYANRGSDLLIQDTDLLSTVVYCRHYFGASPAWIEAAAQARRPALYLLGDIDVPWVADGVRDRGAPAQRTALHAMFVAAVAASGVPYRALQGSWDARMLTAVEAIDALRAGR